MSVPLHIPDLGTGGERVVVTAWLVDEGDRVLEGDRVVELLVPGITFDVQAPVSGTLVSVERNVDDAVSAGDVLGWIEPDDETDSDEEPA